MGTESDTRGEDRWCSLVELSLSASIVTRMIFSSASALSWGRRTLVGEYSSNWHRHSSESENLVVEAPSERVAMSRKGRPKDPHGEIGQVGEDLHHHLCQLMQVILDKGQKHD